MNSFNHHAYGAIGDWMYRQMMVLDTEGETIIDFAGRKKNELIIKK